MNIDTAGNPVYHYDMCAYCSLNTAGQHEPDCPLARPLIIGVPFGESTQEPLFRPYIERDEHGEPIRLAFSRKQITRRTP